MPFSVDYVFLFAAALVQLRCLRLEGPYRQQFMWGPRTEDDMELRVFVFDRELPGVVIAV